MSVDARGIVSETGVSISDVKAALGVSSNDVGTLCTDGNVNKWSFYKPINVNKIAGLVDKDFYDANDGFKVDVYHRPSLIFKAVVGDEAWQYVAPEGGEYSPYRLGDFRNYSHGARQWFIPTFSPSSGRTDDSVHYRYMNDNPDMVKPAEMSMSWLLTNFAVFSPYKSDVDNFYLCLIWSKSLSPNSCYVQKLIKIPELDGNDASNYIDKGIPAHVPSGLDIEPGKSSQDYYVIPCIARIPHLIVNDIPDTETIGSAAVHLNESSEANLGDYYPIPTQAVVFKYLDSSGGTSEEVELKGKFRLTLESGSADRSGNTFSNLAMNMRASLDSNYTGQNISSVNVELYVDNVYELGTTTNKFLRTVSFGAISKGGYDDKTMTYSGSFERLVGKDDSIPIRCEVTINQGSTSTSETLTLYIDNIIEI